MPAPFRYRSLEPELMDAANLSPQDVQDCLRWLEATNVATFAYRPTLAWLDQMTASPPARPVKIFDIGSGRGDMLRKIHRWARKKGIDVDLTGIDVNPMAVCAARAVTASDQPIRYETANVFSLPSERKADFIISSLFAHHLSDFEIIRFVKWMERRAVSGWFINDLHRHSVPYWFIRAATALLCPNALVSHDAPVSVARSFTAEDWRRILGRCGIEDYAVEWRFPFRYCVSRWKT